MVLFSLARGEFCECWGKHRWCAGGSGCHFGQCGWHFSWSRWRMLWYHHSSRPSWACYKPKWEVWPVRLKSFGIASFAGEGVTDVTVGDVVIATPPDGMGWGAKVRNTLRKSYLHLCYMQVGCSDTFFNLQQAILELRFLPGDRCQGGDQSPSNHEPRRSRRRLGKEGTLNCDSGDSGNSGNSGDSGDLLFSCPRS